MGPVVEVSGGNLLVRGARLPLRLVPVGWPSECGVADIRIVNGLIAAVDPSDDREHAARRRFELGGGWCYPGSMTTIFICGLWWREADLSPSAPLTSSIDWE